MSTCIDYNLVQTFVSSDQNRIIGKVGDVLARKSAYINVLGGGTIPNVSELVRTIVQERAVVHTSLCLPQFVADATICGTIGGTDQTGTTEYQFRLMSLRGSGPQVCVKTSRTAFKGSYLAAENSLQKSILQIINADVRGTLVSQSGVKMVAALGTKFVNMVAGDMQQLNTLFPQGLTPSALTFPMVYRAATFLKEEMLAEPFEESNMGIMYKFIGGQDVVDNLRQQLNVAQDLRALTTGRYKLGEESVAGYGWEGPYRGIGFGVDAQPLRFNTFNADGTPAFIEPEVGVSTSQGQGARRNLPWVTAQYEVAFLMAEESFARLVPERFVGEGTFKFAPQLHMGELDWFYIKDRCNPYGDFGQHIYQIQRAYQPIRPQNVLPIIFQRCDPDFGAFNCGAATTGSSSL